MQLVNLIRHYLDEHHIKHELSIGFNSEYDYIIFRSNGSLRAAIGVHGVNGELRLVDLDASVDKDKYLNSTDPNLLDEILTFSEQFK